MTSEQLERLKKALIEVVSQFDPTVEQEPPKELFILFQPGFPLSTYTKETSARRAQATAPPDRVPTIVKYIREGS